MEFTKSTHVWQEVRVSKRVLEELRAVRTTARRETAPVEERGEVRHEDPAGPLH